MGGMIAQVMTWTEPKLVRTLTCLFPAARGDIVAPGLRLPAADPRRNFVDRRVALVQTLNGNATFPVDVGA